MSVDRGGRCECHTQRPSFNTALAREPSYFGICAFRKRQAIFIGRHLNPIIELSLHRLIRVTAARYPMADMISERSNRWETSMSEPQVGRSARRVAIWPAVLLTVGVSLSVIWAAMLGCGLYRLIELAI